jgi:NTE family protein
MKLILEQAHRTNIPLFATWKAKEAIEIGYIFTKELIKEQIRKI